MPIYLIVRNRCPGISGIAEAQSPNGRKAGVCPPELANAGNRADRSRGRNRRGGSDRGFFFGLWRLKDAYLLPGLKCSDFDMRSLSIEESMNARMRDGK